MINDTLIWFLLFPFIGAAAIWWFTGHRREDLIPAAIYVLVCCAAIAATFFISSGSATSDVKIWNGQVTDKKREHGSYVRRYECNCYTTPRTCTGTGTSQSCSGGDRICQTCYEDRYTVDWRCFSTIGTFNIKSLDTTSKFVYLTPDPQRWTIIKPGDPVSLRNTYTNYVQAVPESLFRPAAKELKERFASLIPAYPDRVYDFYKVDRCLPFLG